MIAVNLRAPYIMTKKAMPYLLETKGNVLNTASIAGIKPTVASYAYGASKSGLIQLTKILALELAGRGVRANALCPGIVLTDILGTVSDELMAALKTCIPMGRIGMPEEIAPAAVFMVSDEASYMTGQAVAIDGGFTI